MCVCVCKCMCAYIYSDSTEEVTPDKLLNGEIIELDKLVRRGGERAYIIL